MQFKRGSDKLEKLYVSLNKTGDVHITWHSGAFVQKQWMLQILSVYL